MGRWLYYKYYDNLEFTREFGTFGANFSQSTFAYRNMNHSLKTVRKSKNFKNIENWDFHDFCFLMEDMISWILNIMSNPAIQHFAMHFSISFITFLLLFFFFSFFSPYFFSLNMMAVLRLGCSKISNFNNRGHNLSVIKITNRSKK